MALVFFVAFRAFPPFDGVLLCVELDVLLCGRDAAGEGVYEEVWEGVIVTGSKFCCCSG